MPTQPTTNPKLLKTTLEQATSETSALCDDLETALAMMGEGREQLEAFAAAMPVEVARQLILAVRAARKAVRLVLAQVQVDFPEEV